LLVGLFVANSLTGAILGPPAIWNKTWRAPSRFELVGTYVESKRFWNGGIAHPSATLVLSESGVMVVRDLPTEFGLETCVMNGTGQWRQRDEMGNQGVDLNYKADESKVNTCKSGYFIGFELAGHFKPYSLYWVLGDPDSGNGVWLTKRR
jgi:hypothetical protein